MASIRVERGRNLKSMDPNGLSDPFCLLGVADSSLPLFPFLPLSPFVKSEVKWWTLVPTWKTAILKLEKAQYSKEMMIRIEVWDKNVDKDDDFIGYVVVSLEATRMKGLQVNEWYPLLSRDPTDKVSGDILVSIHFHENVDKGEIDDKTNATTLPVQSLSLDDHPPTLSPTPSHNSTSSLSFIAPSFSSCPSPAPSPSPSSPTTSVPFSFLKDHVRAATDKNKQQRQVRIFLSSTFVDMHEEREEMMRHLMVQLNAFCFERGVSLTYIDMRWGITKEMTVQTILRCLEEVDNSRPYFIGLLAQRYGWHQEVDGADKILTSAFELAEEEPQFSWINGFRTRSVTELEMLHGHLLNGNQTEDHSFFLFRDESYLATKDAAVRKRWEDISEYAKARMSDLKQEITSRSKQGLCNLSHYTDPKQVTSILLPLLKASIEKDFPVEKMDDIQTQNEEHINLARSKCAIYIPNDHTLQKLSHFVTINNNNYSGEDKQEEQKNSNVAMITGPSGSGKSSLIAHWWLSTKDKFALPTFVHFIGSSLLASDFECMILRLFKFINSIIVSRGGVELPISASTESALIPSISSFFHGASVGGGMVIVFDAINQLAPKYHSLRWLPSDIPFNVRVILTTIGLGDHLSSSHAFTASNTIEVKPMDDVDKCSLVKKKLQTFGKTMMETDITRLCSHPCSGNPLFLQTVLGELCIVGYHHAFESQLNSFMDCSSIASLFIHVIQRWEKSFELLARDVLLLVACSSFTTRAFSIAICNEALDSDPSWKNKVFSPILGAGCFGKVSPPQNFYHAQCKLTDHLTQQNFDETVALELPWILSQMIQVKYTDNSRHRDLLGSTLSNLDHFGVFFSNAILKYWELLASVDPQWEKKTKYLQQSSKLISTFATIPTDMIRDQIHTLCSLATFLMESGHLHEAEQITQRLVDETRRHCADNDIIVAKVTLARGRTLQNQGHLGEALANLTQSHSIFLQLNGESHCDTLISIKYIAATLRSQGNLNEALEYYKRSLSIYLDMFGENHPDTASTLINIAITLDSQGNLNEAMEYYKRSLSICLHLFGENHPNTADTMNNIAITLDSQGNLSEALEYYKRSLSVCLHLFGENHPNTSDTLNNIAATLRSQGDLNEAMDYLKRSLSICLHLFGENHPDTASTLNNIAITLESQGNLNGATDYFKRTLSIRLHLFGENHPGTADTMNNIAATLKSQGHLDEAMDNFKRSLSIYLHVFGENHPDTASTLNNIAATLQSQGHLDEAMDYFYRSLSIYLDLFGENHPDTADTLNNISTILKSQGHLKEANEYFKRSLSIHRHLFGR